MYLNFSFSENQRQACNKILTLIDVINETVGDAIADMLLVETILHAKGWDIQDWEQCYTDLPNRLVKVKVKVCMLLSLTISCLFVFPSFLLTCHFSSTFVILHFCHLFVPLFFLSSFPFHLLHFFSFSIFCFVFFFVLSFHIIHFLTFLLV